MALNRRGLVFKNHQTKHFHALVGTLKIRQRSHKYVDRIDHPASAGCRHCFGTGFVGYYVQFTSKVAIVDGKMKREEVKTPILCACVSKRKKISLTKK